ncbi:MAG: ABC transporter substrate binding protein [Woeseia sp.]
MQTPQRFRNLLKQSLLVAITLSAAGCALIDRDTRSTPPPAAKAPRPSPVEPVRETPPSLDARVAIVVTDTLPAYTSVAAELARLLENHTVYNLADKTRAEQEEFFRIVEAQSDAVVAIGLRAAAAAKSRLRVPVVFCQVFNVADNNLISNRVKGVAALPPLDLQVRAWKELNPDIGNIGAIVGEGHDLLIAEAAEATEAAGIELRYRVAKSDRETLYIFNRLAGDIDGFWLFPDNRILSPPVLRQIFKDASRHGVQVAVFNNSLLNLGAAISATSDASDIASTIVSVLVEIDRGELNSIPGMTPLTKMDVRMNDEVLRQFGRRPDSTAAKVNAEQSF